MNEEIEPEFMERHWWHKVRPVERSHDMRSTLTVMSVAGLLILPLAFGDTGIVFTVDTDTKTVRLGESLRLTLKLTGDAASKIVSSTEGATLNFSDGDGFHSNYTFSPKQEGDCTFGPYTLDFNGHRYTSKPLVVRVLPKWNGEFGSFFRVDRNKIELGEEIELVQEMWTQKGFGPQTSRVRTRKATNDYECSSPSSQSRCSFSIKVQDGHPTTNSTYSVRQAWRIKPMKTGIFKITKDLFEAWPDDVTPPDFAVTVEQTSRPPSVPASQEKQSRSITVQTMIEKSP